MVVVGEGLGEDFGDDFGDGAGVGICIVAGVFLGGAALEVKICCWEIR